MTNPPPKFAVGDVVKCVAVFAGSKPSPQQFKIIAVYTNMLGEWYVGQAIGGPHAGTQDALSGDHYEKVNK